MLMVLLRTIENLRARPKDERRAVAFGVAIMVVALLFFGWAIFFFRGVSENTDLERINDAYSQALRQTQESHNATEWQSQVSGYVPASSGTVELIEETGTNFESIR